MLRWFANRQGPLWMPFPNFGDAISTNPSASATMDATGETAVAAGYIFLTSGRGTSKTLSSAGGKIHWRTHSTNNTFGNVSSNLRVGIQGLSTLGAIDTSWQAYADLVGGTDSIVNNTIYATPIETGSTSIVDGSQIAVVLDFTRGGSDSVAASRGSALWYAPYAFMPTRNVAPLLAVIETDDGTVGFFQDGMFPYQTSSVSLSASTNPDEVGIAFQADHRMTVETIMLILASITTSTRRGTVRLYSDPYGTPTQMGNSVTLLETENSQGTAASHMVIPWHGDVLEPNVDYCIAIEGTGTSALSLHYATVSSALRAMMPWGTSTYYVSRQNLTGAFSQTAGQIPLIGYFSGKIDDGYIRPPAPRAHHQPQFRSRRKVI
jgi:hypothetical protein